MSKVSKIHYTDFNALNAMYVKDGVCGVCVEGVNGIKYYVLCSVYSGLSPLPGGKAI